MIQPAVLAGILETHDILHRLDHTDRGRIAPLIAADSTSGRLRDIVADLAIRDAISEIDYRIAET